jgi:hypothetical protein
MHHPNPHRKPPAREPAAAAGQGRSRGRRPRPEPPGFTYEVQVLGGEAGRRLDQEQTEAIAAVLAWLAAHPPTAAAGSAAIGKSVGQSTAMPAGTRPARPSPAGAAASTQRETGSSGGGPAPKPRPGPPDGPGGLEGGGSWSRYPTAVRVQAVGLVEAGRPVGEVAGALGVHPAALRRWVWQAWQRWGSAMGLTQPDSPDPPAARNEGQEGTP